MTITGMNFFRRTIPASVVSITSISASIELLVLNSLNFLVTEAFFNIEELFGDLVFVRVADHADASVPLRSLCTEEVAVDFLFDRLNGIFYL